MSARKILQESWEKSRKIAFLSSYSIVSLCFFIEAPFVVKVKEILLYLLFIIPLTYFI